MIWLFMLSCGDKGLEKGADHEGWCAYYSDCMYSPVLIFQFNTEIGWTGLWWKEGNKQAEKTYIGRKGNHENNFV